MAPQTEAEKAYLLKYHKAYAPTVTCHVCGRVYRQHWMSVRFVHHDGREALVHYRDRPDVRRTDTHVLACERRVGL